jgi:ketosteroid isomerase-like protein
MSQENVEIVRAWAQAFNQRDMDALADLASPSFELVPYLSSMVETTTYRGHDGLRKYFEDADSAWEVIEARLDGFREFGEHFLATGELYGRGRASGLEVVVPLAVGWSDRCGKDRVGLHPRNRSSRPRSRGARE